MNELRIARLDVGDKYIHICVLGEDGEVEEETRIRTTLKAVEASADGKEGMFCLLEVGTHSRWVSEELEKRGHALLVANARHLRMIYGRDTKTDKTDAEVLARVARLDPTSLHAVQHRGKKAHRDLAVVKSRNALVETRTKPANHVRGILKSWGGWLPACSPDNLWHDQYAMEIPKDLRRALLLVLEIIAALPYAHQELRGRDQAFRRGGVSGSQEAAAD